MEAQGVLVGLEVFGVSDDVAGFVFVFVGGADNVVEGFSLPDDSSMGKVFVDLLGGKGLPGVHGFAERVLADRCEDDVHVAGHDYERSEQIALA